MRPDLDPSQMTPDERLREAAAIFAMALLRLRDRAALPANPEQPPPPENLSTASLEPLALPSETSVTVHVG
jgi:hypothetical protein